MTSGKLRATDATPKFLANFARAVGTCRSARGRDIVPRCVAAATAVCRRYDLLTRQREVSDVPLR